MRTVTVQVSLDPEDFELLKQQATAERRSIRAVGGHLLTEAILAQTAKSS